MSAETRGSVAFKQLPQQQREGFAPELPTDTIQIPPGTPPFGEGVVAEALEIIATAPSFDRYSAPSIAQALGSSVYAIVDHPNLPNPIWVTSDEFDPANPISRQNPPFTAGDLLPSPNSPDGTWEVIDWPTGGPSFENKSGMRAQIETRDIIGELQPSLDTREVGGTTVIDLGSSTADAVATQPRSRGESQSNITSEAGARRRLRGLIDRYGEDTIERYIFDDRPGSLSGEERRDLDAIEDILPQNEIGRKVGFDGPMGSQFTDPEIVDDSDGLNVRLPRGITEQDLSGIGAMLSDNQADRRVYGPLTAGKFPSDPRDLRRGAELLQEFAGTRIEVADDYDEAGLYLRVAGLMLQASDR